MLNARMCVEDNTSNCVGVCVCTCVVCMLHGAACRVCVEEQVTCMCASCSLPHTRSRRAPLTTCALRVPSLPPSPLTAAAPCGLSHLLPCVVCCLCKQSTQVLPILLIVLVTFFSTQSEPVYSLAADAKYTHQLQTSRLGVSYWVKDKVEFEKAYPTSSRKRQEVERHVSGVCVVSGGWGLRRHTRRWAGTGEQGGRLAAERVVCCVLPCRDEPFRHIHTHARLSTQHALVLPLTMLHHYLFCC